MKKSHWRKTMATVATSVLALGLLAGCGGNEASSDTSNDDVNDSGKVIKLGGIFDESGATGDVGAPYAEGERAFFEYLNSKGGVDGYKIDFVGEDYAYDTSRAQQVYQSLRDRHEVAAVLGWGTADTEALRQQIINDEIPFFSASYSENLKDTGSESGFNFLVAASYSDQGRAMLEWIQENHEGSKPATVALVYHEGHPFSESPIQDMKNYAAEHLSGEVEIVPDIQIELGDTDPQTTLQSWARSNEVPDYAIINYTWNQTRNVVRDGRQLGWDTQFMGLNWTAGEGLVPSGSDNQQWVDALDGFIGVVTHAFPTEDLPGMEPIIEYLESKGRTVEDINQKFVQGWATASIMAEAVKIAIAETDGDVTGPDIRAAIESIDNFDLGGLGANVSFAPDNHAGTDQIRLGQLNNGNWEIITDYFGVSDIR
ncbi:ABC transporter substrate-binding protein [Alkalihalobacterium alkalinitrilicum]|uniref:ABC transporter substrate-binding protein n=1 Tax=Alkalihalobacterium alkalinitrilicum TaxID=427920 RepID=UPI0009958944|nr:ABC transporter substrate-binding protein [Alkalihalobacterium alkalinitrilicum]